MDTVNHETHSNVLTPEAPLIDPYENVISFYQLPDVANNEKMIRPLSSESEHLARLAFANHFNESIDDIYPDILDTTPERRAMEVAARDFVKQTIGVQPTGNVYWQDATRATPYQGLSGTHDSLYRANYIKVYNHPHDDLKYMFEMSTLVHELAHSTADDGDTIAAFSTKNNDGSNDLAINNHLGMHVIKLEKNDQQLTTKMNGQFFEEAFAEETAARWREQFSPFIANTPHGRWSNGTKKLPLRFFDYNYTSEGPAYAPVDNNSSYPAHALSLLSEKAGVDLYDLMCQARQPEHKAEAKRTFIRAINSVDDGLYQKLRNLQYTEEDFLAGLDIVQDVINTPDTTATE
ncbi:MAG TPA: hypothetical protein VFM68_01555 [Candidatus Saccharimonadales bacterium]|nr:hypothetical protein [Candidatus Saccharimonadales bacterium]